MMLICKICLFDIQHINQCCEQWIGLVCSTKKLAYCLVLLSKNTHKTSEKLNWSKIMLELVKLVG